MALPLIPNSTWVNFCAIALWNHGTFCRFLHCQPFCALSHHKKKKILLKKDFSFQHCHNFRHLVRVPYWISLWCFYPYCTLIIFIPIPSSLSPFSSYYSLSFLPSIPCSNFIFSFLYMCILHIREETTLSIFITLDYFPYCGELSGTS